MTTPDQAIRLIAKHRLIAIVRTHDQDEAVRIVDALVDGGVRVIEFSLAGDASLDALSTSTRRHGSQLLLGAGTVLRPSDAPAAMSAGARFLIAPNLNLDVSRKAKELGV